MAVGDVPVDGSGIPGFDPLSPDNFDAFQVRRGLKGLDCASWASGLGSVNDFSTVDSLITTNQMFESDSPVGALLDNVLGYFAIVNMPHALYIDTTLPSTIPSSGQSTTGRSIEFWGVDDGKTWWMSIDGGFLTPVYQCVNEQCFLDAQQPVTAYQDSLTVPVFPGDTVTVSVFSEFTPHGLLFHVPSALDSVFGVQAFALNNFFTVAPGWTPLVEQIDPRFAQTATGYYYGNPNSFTGSVQLFQGVVRDTALGTDVYAAPTPYNPLGGKANRNELWFTDTVFGPAAMNVRLLAVTNPSHFQ